MMPKQRTSTLTATLLLRCNGKCLMLSALLMGLLVAATQAVDQKSVKASAAEPSALSGGAASQAASGPRDAIYIDDDSIEGSGGRGGIHDDLEKDPDYSGSGFGPDDEDAEPDHHSQHGSHNTRISQSGGSSINTAHTPTQTSSTTSTTTTSSSPTTTTSSTTTSSSSSTTTTAATTTSTTAASNRNQTTPKPIVLESSTASRPLPHFPAFDEDLDVEEEGSGDGLDKEGGSEDDDEGDDEDDIIIDHPDSEKPNLAVPVPAGKEDSVGERIDPDHDRDSDSDNDNDNDDGEGDNDDTEDDDSIIDVDGGHEDGNGIGGNDGDLNTERGPGGGSNVHELDPNTNVNSQPSDTKPVDHRPNGNEVVIMSEDDRTSSFFSQPGILAAVIGGAVVGLLCAILVVMFIVYRMRKKDEGSYALDEPKRSPANNSYAKNANNREFYA